MPELIACHCRIIFCVNIHFRLTCRNVEHWSEVTHKANHKQSAGNVFYNDVNPFRDYTHVQQELFRRKWLLKSTLETICLCFFNIDCSSILPPAAAALPSAMFSCPSSIWQYQILLGKQNAWPVWSLAKEVLASKFRFWLGPLKHVATSDFNQVTMIARHLAKNLVVFDHTNSA